MPKVFLKGDSPNAVMCFVQFLQKKKKNAREERLAFLTLLQNTCEKLLAVAALDAGNLEDTVTETEKKCVFFKFSHLLAAQKFRPLTLRLLTFLSNAHYQCKAAINGDLRSLYA